MILVLLGTFDIPFKRPLLEIEKLQHEGFIYEEVIVQCGHTVIDEGDNLIMKPFIQPQELNELHQKARIIITHAGTGSLIKAIKYHKKVIGVARLAKYGEHVDDHQVEILEQFAKLNYILPWRDGTSLKKVLNEVNDFVPSTFLTNKPRIINYLKDFIDRL